MKRIRHGLWPASKVLASGCQSGRDEPCHHLPYPKEWLKGIVAGTWSKYCLIYPFEFLLVYDCVLWLFHCPFHFDLLLRAYAHTLMPPIHSLALCSLYSKCVCQSCINIGPCMFSSLVIISLLLVTSVLSKTLWELSSFKQELLHQLCLGGCLYKLLPTSSWLQFSISSSTDLLVTSQKSSFYAPKCLSNNQCIHSTWSWL